MVFLLMVILLWGLRGVRSDAQTVKGVVGSAVTITCSHNNAYSNDKYFCKDPCHDQDVLIRSRRSPRSRYRLWGTGNTFRVSITNLKEADTGIYWCGVDRFAVDTYNKVQLNVVMDASPPDVKTTDTASSPEKLVYIGVGLGVAVLVLALVLLLFLRQRSRANRTSSGKNHDITADENPEAESRTNPAYASPNTHRQDTANDLYSNVKTSSESQMRLDHDAFRKKDDGILYSSVTFSKDANCTRVPHTESVTYAAIKNIATD